MSADAVTPTVLRGRSGGWFALLFLGIASMQALPAVADRPATGWGWVRIAVAGAIAIATLTWWVRSGRHTLSLVIDADRVALHRDGLEAPVSWIDRDAAPVMVMGVGSRLRGSALVAEQSIVSIGLDGFDPTEVVRVCADHGWPVSAPVRGRPRRMPTASDLLP